MSSYYYSIFHSLLSITILYFTVSVSFYCRWASWRSCNFLFSSRRRHTRLQGDWSSDVCSSDLGRVQQREDALRRGHRALQDVELLRQVHDRPEEALRVHDEGHQRPERQRALQHPSAADPDNQRRGYRAHQLDGGIEHRVEKDRIDVRVAMPAIDFVELGKILLFPPKELHGRHARDPFLQERVDPGDPGPHVPVRLAHVRPEPLRDEGDQREH